MCSMPGTRGRLPSGDWGTIGPSSVKNGGPMTGPARSLSKNLMAKNGKGKKLMMPSVGGGWLLGCEEDWIGELLMADRKD